MRQLITHQTDIQDYATGIRTSEISDYSYCGIENTGIKFLIKYNPVTGSLVMHGESGSIEKLKQGATEGFSFSQFLKEQEKALVFQDYQEGLFWLSGYSYKLAKKVSGQKKKQSLLLKLWDFVLNSVFVVFAIPTVFFGSFCLLVVFIAYLSSDTKSEES